MSSRSIVDEKNIATDEHFIGKKDKIISIEFQKFVYKSFIERTNYKVIDENGVTVHLEHVDHENVVVDFSEDDNRLEVYQLAVKDTLERLKTEIENPNLEKKIKEIMMSLIGSLDNFERLEFDNIHLVYDKNDFNKKHEAVLMVGNQIMTFRTPYLHLVEVTMESDKNLLEKKLENFFKQLIFIMEYPGHFFSIFFECFSILDSLQEKKLNLYGTIVSGYQFRETKLDQILEPEDVFNELSEYQNHKIFECLRANELLKEVSEFVEPFIQSDAFKLRNENNFKINHLIVMNPFSSIEIGQLFTKFDLKLTNSINENKKMISDYQTYIDAKIENYQTHNMKEISSIKSLIRELFSNCKKSYRDDDSKLNDLSKNEQSLSTELKEPIAKINQECKPLEDIKSDQDSKNDSKTVSDLKEDTKQRIGLKEDLEQENKPNEDLKLETNYPKDLGQVNVSKDNLKLDDVQQNK